MQRSTIPVSSTGPAAAAAGQAAAAALNGSSGFVPLKAVISPHHYPPHAVRTFPGGIVRYWTEAHPQGMPSLAFGFTESWREDIRHFAYWEQQLQLRLFRDIAIWKAASIELLGTCILTAIIILIVTGVLNHTADYSYFPTAIATLHIPLIAFMILATGATSGAHLNPMISLATCLAGLTEFPRMVLYIIAQIVGAIIGSYLCKHLTPSALLPVNVLAMCSIGIDQSVSQAFTMEFIGDLFVLYVAFGVALDERQRQSMPAWLPPFVIAIMIAMLIYATSTISRFGNGAIAFPTRCFGPAVAMGLVTADSFTLGNGVVVSNAQWIYWIGPLCASFVIAFFYRLVPPGYTVRIQAERRQSMEQMMQPQPSGI